MFKRFAVVDGSNIAHVEESKNGKPKVSNIVAVEKALREEGYETVVIVDAALRHEIDDAAQLESLIDTGVVHQAPAGTDADYFVIETAEEKNAVIVSNDVYKDFAKEHPWIQGRRLPLMIIDGNVELYKK